MVRFRRISFSRIRPFQGLHSQGFIFQGFESQGFVLKDSIFEADPAAFQKRPKLASSGASAAPKNIDLKGTVNSLRAARQRPKNNPPVRSGGSIAKPELRESLAQRPMGRWRRARSSISGGDPT
jgi:hypothetical protein